MTLDLTGYERAGHRLMNLRARRETLTLTKQTRTALADTLALMLVGRTDSAVAAAEILEILEKRVKA